jgi:hypothetical protein
MDDEDKVNCADQVDEGTRWIGSAQRSAPESVDHISSRQLGGPRDTGIIRPEGVKLMSVRRGDEWLTEALCNFDGASVRIEEAAPEMAELDGVEMIDVFKKSLPNRTAEKVKRMGRDHEEGCSEPASQPGEIIQSAERRYIVRRDVQQNYVGAFKTNLSRRDQKDAHAGRVREHFRAVKNRVVKGDGENPKAKAAGPLQELMRGVIERVLRIVERMDMEIELHPLWFSHVAANYTGILNPLFPIVVRRLLSGAGD